MSRILVLAPHTDDGELGCGATISNLIRNKHEVYYVAFSSCRQSLPAGMPKDTLVKELYSATAALGIERGKVSVLDFQVRFFERDRQEILESMVQLNEQINPDIVLSPSQHDVHQDHLTVANECMRAFKNKTIFQYEIPWNNYTFNNQIFFCVEQEDVDAKLRAVECYSSQNHRMYTKKEFITGNLMVHGVQIGVKYAEVFETPHMIITNRNI